MLPRVPQSHTSKSRWVMHTSVALPWVTFCSRAPWELSPVSAKAACLTGTLPWAWQSRVFPGRSPFASPCFCGVD